MTESKTREESLAILEQAKGLLEIAKTKDQTLEILERAGNGVGYKPAFRALVANQPIEECIKWGKD